MASARARMQAAAMPSTRESSTVGRPASGTTASGLGGLRRVVGRLMSGPAKLVDHPPQALRAEVQFEPIGPDIDAGHEQLHDPGLFCWEQLFPEGIEPLQCSADYRLRQPVDSGPGGAPSGDDDLG
jgi:hypothetical protein